MNVSKKNILYIYDYKVNKYIVVNSNITKHIVVLVYI